MAKKLVYTPILLFLSFVLHGEIGEIDQNDEIHEIQECTIQEFRDRLGRVVKVIEKSCEVVDYFYCKNGEQVNNPNKCKIMLPRIPQSIGQKIDKPKCPSIQGCEGGEMSPDGKVITCPDGRIYKLDHTAINDIHRFQQKTIIRTDDDDEQERSVIMDQ